MVIWLTGLSGAGKSTVAQSLCQQLKKIEPNTVLVDGDVVRRLCGTDQSAQDYNLTARRLNAERIVEFCLWLDNQGMNVVCAILCLFDDIMINNRKRFSSYFQVHLQASLLTLQNRDPKGLYARASRGEVGEIVGIDFPYLKPSTNDLDLCTEQGAPSADVLARQILALSKGIK